LLACLFQCHLILRYEKSTNLSKKLVARIYILLSLCFGLLTILGAGNSKALARANFSGHWVANSGKVSSNVGISASCSKVEIIIEQNEKEFITKKYESTCNFFGSQWGPVKQDLNGEQVLEQGEVVGSISDDTLITTAPSGTAAYAYNLKLVKNPMEK
jgi:hypothetical protein